MSREIDERVVSMEFDNKGFEKHAAESLSTLEKLKKALKFDKTSDEIDEVGTSLKSLNTDSINRSLSETNSRFSAFEEIATGALRRVGYQAVESAEKIIKGFSGIGMMTKGWGKYEEDIQSVQTIMAATGKSIEEVESVMERLMWFSDETSYSYTDMANNIGKFTSAGVDLETASDAMQGIATWAALSGQNATTASRAMYQLSQSLGAGKVTKQDWNSIVNANMATREFKQVVIDTAKELKTLTKNAEVTTENFAETLTKEGWFTRDVLMKSLSHYSSYAKQVKQIQDKYGFNTAAAAIRYLDNHWKEEGLVIDEIGRKAFKAAQEAKTWSDVMSATTDAVTSGWMQTWKLIFGNYVEAKELFSSIADSFWSIFAGGSEFRNDFIKKNFVSGFDDLSEVVTKAGYDYDEFKMHFEKVGEVVLSNYRELVSAYGSVEDAAKNGKVSSKDLEQIVKETSKQLKDNSGTLEYYIDLVKKIWRGDYGNNPVRQKKLTEAGYDYAKIQELVNEYGEKHVLTEESIERVGLRIRDNAEAELATYEQILKTAEETGMSMEEIYDSMTHKSGSEAFTHILTTSLETIANIMEAIRTAFYDVFFDNKAIRNFLDSIDRFVSRLAFSDEEEEFANQMDMITNIFKGLFYIVDAILSVFKELVSYGIDFVSNAFDLNLDTKNILKTLSNIGSNVSSFVKNAKQNGGIIKTVFENIRDALIKVKSTTDETTESLTELSEAPEKGVNSLLSTLTSVKDYLSGPGFKDTFSSIGKWIIDGLTSGIDENGNRKMPGIVGFFKSMVEKIKAFLGINSPSKMFIQIGEFIIAGLVIGVLSGLPQVNSTFQSIIESIINTFNSIDWDKVFVAATLLAMIAAIDKIATSLISVSANVVKGIDTVASAFAPLQRITSSVTTILNTLNGAAGEFKSVFTEMRTSITDVKTAMVKDINANAFKKIGVGLLMIVGALGAVALMIKAGLDLKQAGLYIAAFLASLLAIAYVAKGESAGQSITSMAISIVAIAAGLAILLKTLQMLMKVVESYKFTLEGAMTFIGSLSLMIVMLAISMKAIKALVASANKNSAGTLVKVPMVLFSLALSLQLMALSLYALKKLKFEEIITSLGTMAAMMYGVVVFTKAISKIDGVDKLKPVIKFMVGFASFSLIMVGVVKLLNLVKLPEILKAAGVLIGFGGIMVFISGLVSVVNANGSQIRSFSNMILSFTASLVILGAAIAILGKIKPSTTAKAMITIASIGTIMGILSRLVSKDKAEFDKIGSLIAKIGGAMALIAVAFRILKGVTSEQAKKCLAIVGSLFGIVWLFIMGLNLTKNTGADFNKIGSLLMKLTVPLIALVAVIALLSMIKDLKSMLSSAAAVVGVIGAISALIYTMPNLNAKSVSSFAIMATIIGVLVGGVYLISKSNVSSTKVKNITSAITIAALGISVAARILATVDIDFLKAITVAAESVIFIGALGLVTKAIDMLNISDGAARTMVQLIGVLGLLAVVMSAFGLATKFIGIVNIAEATGLIALVASIIGGLFYLFGTIADANGLDIDDIKTKIGKAVDVAIAISSGIGEIIGAFLSGIVAGTTVDLSIISQNLSTFFEDVKDLDTSFITPFSQLSTSLLNLVNVGYGTSNISKVAAALPDLGKGVSEFADAIDGVTFDSEQTDKAIAVIGAVASVKTTIGNDHGIFQWIAGWADLEQFGKNLESLGEGLSTFMNKINPITFDKDKVDEVVKILATVASVKKDIPETGGVVQWFAGMSDLGQFGINLSLLGSGLANFMNSVSSSKDVDSDKVDRAISLLQTFADIQKSLGEEKTLFGWLTGTNTQDLGDFGKDLKKLGESLIDFDSTVGTSDLTATGRANVMLKQFIDMFKTGENFDGSSLDSLASGINKIAIADIAGLVEKFSDKEGVSAALEGIKSLMTTISEGIVDEESQTNIAQALTTSIELMTKIIDGSSQDFTDKGKKIIGSISSGILEGAGVTVSEDMNPNTLFGMVRNVMYWVKKIVSDSIPAFTGYGMEICDRLAEGISTNAYKVTDAMKALSIISEEVFEEELHIDSPSKRFYNDGKYIDEGLANGIEENTGIVEKSIGKAGSWLSNALGIARDKVQETADSLQLNPVITPIVDMTNWDNAAGSIAGFVAENATGLDVSGINRWAQTANDVMSGNIHPFTINATFNVETPTELDEAAAETFTEMIGEKMGNFVDEYLGGKIYG